MTIKEVAARAGVSVASVSRVLSGTGAVSQEVRARVLAAVKALDYRPNLAARRLRSRRTDTIGLVVADIRNPFFTEVSRAVEDVAFRRRMGVLLLNTDEDPEKEASCLQLMKDENVAGVILSPTLKLLSRFRAADLGFPVVLVDRSTPDVDADAVVLDNVAAARGLTEHLLASGHRRVALLYGSASATGQQRHEGYVEAMRARGLRPLAVGVSPKADAAREAAAELLGRTPRPAALLASSGLILLGLMEAVRASRLEVPRDVAMAGFDDLPWTQLVRPGITVVAQPTYDIGREAIEALLRRIANPGIAPRRVVLRGTLQARGSTATGA